jgi:thioredoxin 1
MNTLRNLFFILILTATTGVCTADQITKGQLYTPGTAKQFHDMVTRYDLAVVDFYADWCHPCLAMHKVFDALAQDRDLEDILFVKVDTEKHWELSYEFNIRSLPTIILFVDGQPIARLHGHHNKHQLKRIIIETFDRQSRFFGA